MAQKKTPAKTGTKKKAPAKKSTAKPKETVDQAQEQAQVPERPVEPEPAPDNTRWFVRNIRNVPVRLHFERHQPGKGINLEPRGNRGDIAPIEDIDFSDQTFPNNRGFTFEVLTAQEAREITAKQAAFQQAPHPALDGLRNQLDQPYENPNPVVVQEDDGVVVGTVNVDERAPRTAPQIDRTKSNITDQGEIPVERLNDVGPRYLNTPGSENPGPGVNNDIAALQDAVARDKSLQGPQAGGITKVQVADVQKG